MHAENLRVHAEDFVRPTRLEFDSMVTRSGAGGALPPAVGVITDRVIAKRPDLNGMYDYTVQRGAAITSKMG